MDSELEALMASLSPEELEQLMGLGTLDEQGALLEQQQAQAQGLLRGGNAQRTTGIGAALSGLGDAVGAGVGAYRQGKLNEQQKALVDQKQTGRNLYADALRRKPQGASGMPDLLKRPEEGPEYWAPPTFF